MATKRTSIYVGEALASLLDTRARPDDGFRSTSGVLNAVSDRYLEIIRRSAPTLSVGEWCMLWDSLNGVWMQDNASLYVGSLTQGVSDSIGLDSLDRKWKVDGHELLAKLHGMSFCELLAIVDTAERFWMDSGREGEEYPELVRRIVGERGVEP